MASRRLVDVASGEKALAAWRVTQLPPGGSGGHREQGGGTGAGPEQGGGSAPLKRSVLATAVRYTLEELADRAPGRSVEVRVPPHAAVQCIDGPRHTRGTPPNVIETDAETWLRLATGALSWAEAEESGAVRSSGTRADLTAYLPVL